MSATTVTGATTTTTTTTSTTNAGVRCGGVVHCLHENDSQCAQCLEAINATAGFPHTNAEYDSFSVGALGAYNVGFFRALQSTASCSTNATLPNIIQQALQELSHSRDDEGNGMIVDACLVHEYACFVDPDCRQCFAALLAAAADSDDGSSNGTKVAAFRSPACTATSPTLRQDLANHCGEQFPACTSIKQRCASLPECASCLAMLGDGDGAEAARQCRGSTQPSAVALDIVVSHCIGSNAVACDFWRQRCADNANCAACLANMGNGDSLSASVADWSTPACQQAVADDFFAPLYLNAIGGGCPGISTCRFTVTDCVVNAGDVCLACLNGSASPRQAPLCAPLSQGYSFDTACQPCSSSVHTINLIVFATALVGGASAAACLVVVATIAAHGRDRVSMRDRIVVGLMMANAVYSTANTIPLNALRSSVIDCGRLAMSFDAIRFGRAWWFCGKYGLVSFELLILGASIRALLRGDSAVPRCAEAAMHTACYAIAALAFGVFYALCSRVNANGYNARTEGEVYTNAFNHASVNDDLDDDVPSTAASLAFQSARDAYDNLVRDMLVTWDVVVGVAVVMWIVLRALHLQALRALRTEAAAAADAEENDVWRDTRRSAWGTRRCLLEARREAFNEIAKPLEPYIFVFVVFAGPAFVMSTPFCQAHSGASTAGGAGASDGVDGASTDFTYGTCDVWCEFALAFRSLGAVAVYLAPRQRRAELVAVHSTWSKLCTRVIRCVQCAPSPYTRFVHDHHDGEYEMDELELQTTTNDNNNNNDNNCNDINDNGATVATTDASSARINECDFTKERVLGKGAFGEVWDCLLKSDGQRVAVKIMLAGAVDEDGDVVDLNADEDFRKECAALQRIDSPHLLKFYGFGTTAEGNGFIVTELMLGGALEDVLHDPERDVPWRLRVQIGWQVALGMEHLHKRLMLHRDLKSANVLLDEELNAKVCDFGLSRVVKPARRHVVVRSSFTGVTQLLPRVDGIDINVGHTSSALSMARIAVSFLNARGTMTKAAGTLLWMAPEVFRGDQTYTRAVDVYSFGVVLWELATRATPWVSEMSSDPSVFFEEMNRALQTGRRPAIPNAVRSHHSAFVAVMTRCWASDPADRPTFAEAARDLVAILSAED
jgi:serine/threonine protein kinase